MRVGLLSLVVLVGCVTPPRAQPAPVIAPPAPAPSGDEEVRGVTLRFVDAVAARDFAGARALLSQPLRDRYTVERLAADFSAEPLASARLAEIRLKAGGPFRLGDGSASLEWAPGRSLRLLRNAEGWRISGIE